MEIGQRRKKFSFITLIISSIVGTIYIDIIYIKSICELDSSLSFGNNISAFIVNNL